MANRGFFIIMVGLPGSGKSTLARIIEGDIHDRKVEVLDGDQINKELNLVPTYSHQELVELHKRIHTKAFKSLLEGKVVIYDATNILDKYRKSACQLAARTNADYLIVNVVAEERLIFSRLEARQLDASNYSEADLTVYHRMKEQFEPIMEEHITVQSAESGFVNLDYLLARIHTFNRSKII